MTVSESIIAWLKQFNPTEYWKMKSIDTDIQRAEVESYALIKEPVQNVKRYLSGATEYTDHYSLSARLTSQGNTERIDNNGFGEALEGWVYEQNQLGNFPTVENAKVSSISVTTPFYIGKTESDNSIYSMTIAIKYSKER